MGELDTIEVLLSRLRSLDIKLWVEGDRLRYDAPKGALTPELRDQLHNRKAEIIALLRCQPEIISGQRYFPPSFVQQRLWSYQQLNPNDCFLQRPPQFSPYRTARHSHFTTKFQRDHPPPRAAADNVANSRWRVDASGSSSRSGRAYEGGSARFPERGPNGKR